MFNHIEYIENIELTQKMQCYVVYVFYVVIEGVYFVTAVESVAAGTKSREIELTQ